jgi:hypothetical protein
MTERASAARRFAVHHNEEVRRTTKRATAVGLEATRRMEDVVDNAYSRTAQGTTAFYQKLLAIAHDNVDAAFDCTRDLLEQPRHQSSLKYPPDTRASSSKP